MVHNNSHADVGVKVNVMRVMCLRAFQDHWSGAKWQPGGKWLIEGNILYVPEALSLYMRHVTL